MTVLHFYKLKDIYDATGHSAAERKRLLEIGSSLHNSVRSTVYRWVNRANRIA